jgi:hypothetical protein
MNLPNYEFLSAPLWLITTLHLLTLSLHLVAMNFLLGGVIVVVHGAMRGRGQRPALARWTQLLPTAMAATVTIGVAPLLFLQLVYPRQAYAAAIVSGWFWLLIVAAVIVVYTALYVAAVRSEKSGKIHLPALLVALIGLLYVSIAYGSIFAMAERPELIHQLYAKVQSGLVWNPATGDYLLRWLHMVLGAVTVGGFCVAALNRDDAEMYQTGKSFFVGGMALGSLVGLTYLVSLAPYLVALMHTPGIWALMAAIACALGALHFFFAKNLAASGAMLFVSLFGMVYARHTVRLVKLAGQFDPGSWRVAPQWGPFLLFLVCFVAALATMMYMLQLFFARDTAN